MKGSGTVAIVIPSLNPVENLPGYVAELRSLTDAPILLVDDGSRADKRHVFDACMKSAPGVSLVTHEVNRGKGRALKTSFTHLLGAYPDLVGCVTCDSDGQHLPGDVMRCVDALRESPEALVVGCRTFTLENVPLRSRFGNTAIRGLFRIVTGRDFLDTQTGLRAIPASFMRELLDCPGERFEFETHMLLRMGDRELLQLPIETVYIDGNKESHFNPLKDSARITAIVVADGLLRFLKFIAASLLSCGVDIALFALFYHVVFGAGARAQLLASVALARVASVCFNYLCNRFFVFGTPGRRHVFGRSAFPKYVFLALCIFGASYWLTKIAHATWPQYEITYEKAAVDLLLFFVSYGVQRVLIFRRR